MITFIKSSLSLLYTYIPIMVFSHLASVDKFFYQQ